MESKPSSLIFCQGFLECEGVDCLSFIILILKLHLCMHRVVGHRNFIALIYSFVMLENFFLRIK